MRPLQSLRSRSSKADEGTQVNIPPRPLDILRERIRQLELRMRRKALLRRDRVR